MQLEDYMSKIFSLNKKIDELKLEQREQVNKALNRKFEQREKQKSLNLNLDSILLNQSSLDM